MPTPIPANNTFTKMIKIQKNENFAGFFNVLAFGKFVKQVQGRLNANSFAVQLVKEHNQTHYLNHRNKIVEVKCK